MTQNDLQSGQNNSDEAPIIVDKTARFVAKNGLEFERRIIASYPKDDTRFGFLKNPEDPFHQIYQKKLAEYLAQDDIQETETDDHTRTIQIIEPPPGLFRQIVEGTARLVSKKGLKAEIAVESLSENVASLKEKIAGEIQIPADRLKLSGKAGFLEDENRSLAHYNVGAGENLTLSL